MENIIAPAVVGAIICVLGILNLCGNLSLLHSYHYKRVSAADKKPFCTLVGIGTMLIGVGMLLFSLFAFLTKQTENLIFTTVGAGLLIAAAVIGIILNFYAMIKYNHGIF